VLNNGFDFDVERCDLLSGLYMGSTVEIVVVPELTAVTSIHISPVGLAAYFSRVRLKTSIKRI